MKTQQRSKLIDTLKTRFEENSARHKGVDWEEVEARLEANPGKLNSLQAMEDSGGEPDVVARDRKTGKITFYDCSPESPRDRRSLCYDREALKSRKENKPKDNAIDAAAEMGIELLTEEQYRKLQDLGEFDLKTSSWLLTPPAIRELGGALFGDRRYDHVFVYHNGAQSYYAARGFRGALDV